MKVLHISPSFYPAHIYGGPIQSVFHLCRHLSLQGVEIKVLTTNANGPGVLDTDASKEVDLADRVMVRYCPRIMRETVSPSLVAKLSSYMRWADVVHLTAVYSFPTIPTLLAAKMLDKPVVWSPRGSLQRWPGSTRLGMKDMWHKVCQMVSPRDLTLHVTSNEEAAESLDKLPGLKTVLIPNAVSIPQVLERTPRTGALRILSIGRLHQKKGIENLLEACAQLSIDWSLSIVGTGDPAYTESLRNKIVQLGLSHRARMLGELVGDAKRRIFETSDVMVAPSFSENFGMVVAEALAHGVPVIASKFMPWKEMEEAGGGMWIDNDPASVRSAIEAIEKRNLAEMGAIGRQWIQKDYAWETVARQMADAYRQVAKPEVRAGSLAKA